MTALIEPAAVGSTRRWTMLGASTLAQAASAVMPNGMPFLIPALHARDGLSMATAGVVVTAPTVGVTLTLVAWGWLADHRGERVVLLIGLTATAIFAALAVPQGGLVLFSLLLGLGGAAAASVNSASGRVVVGWFPPQRRGLAMGIRQMAQPAGVGIAALAVPTLAAHHGVHAAMWIPAGAAAASAILVAIVVVDPPRPVRTVGTAPNPYRQDRYLARIHGVSVLLVVPQFVVWTFALAWLIQERHWSPAGAGGWSPPRRSSGRSAGSRLATSPMSSAAGCDRCAGSPSAPARRWRCSDLRPAWGGSSPYP